ncbi:S-layer homology domain-containing protein [Paenibacillus sp. IITD108]|uniref:S-layer homology domain-containing protein n=1 Tax=Paenibacillus sp. IITD108 TaxID=3116649 RepID=UPI002F41B28A
MKQRLLSLFLTLVLAVNLIPATVFAAGAWDGSAQSQPAADGDGVYQIGTAAELAWFRDHVNVEKDYTANAVLTADIDLNNQSWTPIGGGNGYATTYFGGRFDGQGHVIKNFNINANYNFAGFFGYVKGTITNLQIKDADISSSSNNVGGIAGTIIDGEISNSSFSGTVTNTKSSSGYAGGIAGYVGNTNATSPLIQSSANYGTITGPYAGGITAYAKFSLGIKNSYNAGTIIGPDKASGRVGGIAGQVMNNTPIENSYNIGIVSGTVNIPGGIAGFSGTSITNSYWLNPEVGIGGGTGTTSSVDRITSPEGLLEKLGSAFVADTSNVNGGYPILAWQSGSVTAPDTTPSISLKGDTTLYVQQGAGSNYTTLTAVKTNMDDLDAGDVIWSIEKKGGGDAAKIAVLEGIENTNDSVIVRAVGGGVVTVTATVVADEVKYTDSRDITIIPQITTASIANINTPGAVAVGQTVKATVYVNGGEEYDYDNYPSLTYQWKYRSASGSMTDIPGATGQTFTIPAAYNEWDFLHVEVRSGGTLVVDGANVYVSIRSKDYGELYPVAYDPAFTLPADKKDDTAIDLPVTHKINGVTSSIVWTSSNTDVIDVDGTVMPPESGKEAVTLTARFEYGESYANRTFIITVWSESAVAEDTDSNRTYLQQAAAALGNWYSLVPVYGADTNVAAMLTTDLAAKGYGDISVAVKAATEVYGNSSIASNGDITYFYADPNSMRGLWFGRYDVSFVLTKGDESLDLKDVPVTIHWDVNEVKAAMSSQILSGVDETAILGTNTDKNNVISNLILPKVVNDKKWALISWTSSDAGAIAISNENQGTADTLFSPYIGQVIRGAKDKDVTLTAAFTFQRTSAEPSIVMYKTFTVTVKALSGAEADALRAELLQKLDAGFSSAGLKDYVTGQQLNAVEDVYSAMNDIQLPTTRDFGVDGKYYPVTITSSDEDTIAAPDVANAARVMVYRPLAGETVKTVTLTVTLSDKQKGVAASKEFQINVQPLTQAEIDDALVLMDMAISGYFDGLNNGKYADSYSVTGNLSSFKEAVWNDTHDAIAWVYSEQNRLRNGITSDELENWAEQEAWRVFRSSDPSILAHESLHLVAKPEQDTFVRVNSVLTHEVFGKYWDKFAGVPGYEVFKLLYKQPVSEYIMVEGKNHQKQPQDTLLALRNLAVARIDTPIEVGFTLQGTGGMLIQTTVRGLKSGPTVFEVFRTALAEAGYTYTSRGSYVQAITDPNGNTLSEKDGGPNSGWIYKVNGVMPSIYMNGFSLKDGDKIVVSFTQDYTKEDLFENSKPDGNLSGGGNTEQPNITVPAGDEISLNAIRTGSTVAIDMPSSIVNDMIDNSKDSTLVLDLSKLTGVTDAVLPTSAVTQLADAKLDLEIKLPQGTMTFAAGALQSMKQAVGTTITLSLNAVTPSELTTIQREAVKSGDLVFNISASSDAQAIHNFDGKITVSVPYSGALPVAVWYLNDSGKLEKIPCSYNTEEKTVTFVTYHLSLYVVGMYPNPFADVKSEDWFYSAVTYAYGNGLMKGTEADKFSPESGLTRGMVVTVLYRFAGEPNASSLSNPFNDVVNGKYYTDAVKWAAANGIVSGLGNGRFAPDDYVTREQMALMLLNYELYSGKIPHDIVMDREFADWNNISDWAKSAVNRLTIQGIISGKLKNLFDPKGNATRAEFATVLYRFAEAVSAE